MLVHSKVKIYINATFKCIMIAVQGVEEGTHFCNGYHWGGVVDTWCSDPLKQLTQEAYTGMVWGHVSYGSAMVWCMVQKTMYVQ